MKRAIIILIIGCGCGLVSLAVSHATALKRTREANAANLASAPLTQLPQQVIPITPAVLAVAGLPVTLTTGGAANDKGFSELPSRIHLTSIADITSANLVLFEVDRATGKVQGIESWTRIFDPSEVKTDQRTGGRAVDLGLRVRRHVNGQHPLLLALESVSSSNQTWQVDSSTLLQAALTKASGKPEILLPVQQKADPRSADYGMNHCARAFAIAVAFGKFSDNAGGLPGFTCDQQTRDFSITYGSAKAAPTK